MILRTTQEWSNFLGLRVSSKNDTTINVWGDDEITPVEKNGVYSVPASMSDETFEIDVPHIHEAGLFSPQAVESTPVVSEVKAEPVVASVDTSKIEGMISDLMTQMNEIKGSVNSIDSQVKTKSIPDYKDDLSEINISINEVNEKLERASDKASNDITIESFMSMLDAAKTDLINAINDKTVDVNLDTVYSNQKIVVDLIQQAYTKLSESVMTSRVVDPSVNQIVDGVNKIKSLFGAKNAEVPTPEAY